MAFTGAAKNEKKRGGDNFFTLNHGTATKKVSAGPISFYQRVTDLILLLPQSDRKSEVFLPLRD